jgi:hypothetical protein
MRSFSAQGHHYELTEAGLTYRDPEGREYFFPFSERLRISVSTWTNRIRLRGPQGRTQLDALPESDQKALLLELFSLWRQHDPDAAKKAAFDYLDGQRGFEKVAFFTSLFFFLPVALLALEDSRQQFSCTRELRAESVVGEMQVVRSTKKRKGQYQLILEFVAPNGEKIAGREQLLTENETTIPKKVPVVYSPSNPQCWALPTGLQGSEISWAKRRFFGFFTLFFGISFLGIALGGLTWGARRWRQKRPFAADLAQLFGLRV